MKLIRYCRVSSHSQVDAYGLPAQHKDCAAWAARHGYELVVLGDEVYTGTLADRPLLGEAVHWLREGSVDGLLVPRLDRLARALTVQEAVLAMVWQLGGRVFAADEGEILQDDPDDPMRTAMRQMQGVFAQLERSMLTKRMRAGMRIKAAQGRHATGIYPFGYRGHHAHRTVDKGPHEDEQPTVARILELRSQGETYRAIAARLDHEGRRPRYAKSWSAMAVRNVWERERRSPTHALAAAVEPSAVGAVAERAGGVADEIEDVVADEAGAADAVVVGDGA